MDGEGISVKWQSRRWLPLRRAAGFAIFLVAEPPLAPRLPPPLALAADTWGILAAAASVPSALASESMRLASSDTYAMLSPLLLSSAGSGATAGSCTAGVT